MNPIRVIPKSSKESTLNTATCGQKLRKKEVFVMRSDVASVELLCVEDPEVLSLPAPPNMPCERAICRYKMTPVMSKL